MNGDASVTAHDVQEAAERIRGRVRVTPVVGVEAAAFALPFPVDLKLELLQHSGSFKPRGMFNRALSSAVPEAGLIVASGGNAGLAVAHVGRELHHTVEVFVPETAPAVKVDKLRAHGAEVRQVGPDYATALLHCQERAGETGALVMHAYDQADVMAGQGTVGLELEEQLGSIDTVLVACGGGGLIGGIAAWFAGRVRVISVEPTGAATLAASRAAGERVRIEVGGVAADALGASQVGEVLWALPRDYISETIVVSGPEILAARERLWDQLRICAEPGGATALAALMGSHYVPSAGERVAVIVCGGNSDPATLGQRVGD